MGRESPDRVALISVGPIAESITLVRDPSAAFQERVSLVRDNRFVAIYGRAVIVERDVQAHYAYCYEAGSAGHKVDNEIRSLGTDSASDGSRGPRRGGRMERRFCASDSHRL